MEWKITYFNKKVSETIEKWPDKLAANYLRIIELIEEFGPQKLDSSMTKALGDGLFEIRARSKEGIGRAFYCYIVKKEIVILHAFIKKTQKTPSKELELARKRMKEVVK